MLMPLSLHPNQREQGQQEQNHHLALSQAQCRGPTAAREEGKKKRRLAGCNGMPGLLPVQPAGTQPGPVQRTVSSKRREKETRCLAGAFSLLLMFLMLAQAAEMCCGMVTPVSITCLVLLALQEHTMLTLGSSCAQTLLCTVTH